MGKRILFLTPQLPFPPQQGTAIRNYNLIVQVAARHEVHLLSFLDRTGQTADVGPLRAACASVRTVPAPHRGNAQRLFQFLTSPLPDMAHRLASPAFQQALDAALRDARPDVLQVEGLELASYAMHALSGGEQAPSFILDAHNAEYVLQQRIFETDSRHPRRWVGAVYSWVQWQRLRSYEARACRLAAHVVACSAADARALIKLAPSLRPVVVPNGVDTAMYRPGIVLPATTLSSRALVFTGKMDFRPNVDAVLWFATHVLPLIRAACPDAHLFVVGKNPHPRLAPLAEQPGITLTGFVEDVRPYIAAASVYVVPLLTGGGTRLKVLEAMAMGKATVSTTLGCEGINATSGEDIVLADTALDFAGQVLDLLENAPRRVALGQAARAFVEGHSDWRSVVAPLESLYEG